MFRARISLMQVTIPKTKGNDIFFEGRYWPVGREIDVDFSKAMRMRRDLNAIVPYVHNDYDPSLWRDGKRATFIADINGSSGWGNVGLNLVKYSTFARFSLVGKTYNLRDPHLSAALQRPVEEGSAAIWHEQPKAEWLTSPFSRNIAVVPFETTLVPESWVPRLNYFDAVLVPCRQNVRMMKDSGVTRPVELIHWGVDTDKFQVPDRPRRDDTFTFGTMGALSKRKGTDILVEAFTRAFPTEKDVRLICKTSLMQYMFMSRDKRIEVQMGPVPHEDLMRDFFARTDCFVFPTLGEGFGLTPLEAMATGIPAIVTGWSGPADYMTPETGWTIDYSMDEARAFSDPREGVYKENCGQWAIPSMDHLIYLMRHAYEHRDEVRAKGQAAAEYVRREWTWPAQIGLFEAALNKHL